MSEHGNFTSSHSLLGAFFFLKLEFVNHVYTAMSIFVCFLGGLGSCSSLKSGYASFSDLFSFLFPTDKTIGNRNLLDKGEWSYTSILEDNQGLEKRRKAVCQKKNLPWSNRGWVWAQSGFIFR